MDYSFDSTCSHFHDSIGNNWGSDLFILKNPKYVNNILLLYAIKKRK